MSVTAAIVGAGRHGRLLGRVLQSIDGVHVVGVADRSPAALAGLDVPGLYEDADEMFRELRPDLVVVATHAPSHAEIARSALRHGARFLLVEKPMACSLGDARQIIEDAAAADARLAVDHPRRHTEVYSALANALRDGSLGTPRAIWIHQPGIGLGCLGTHSFDLARLLMGVQVTAVTAWLDPEFSANPRGSEFHDPGGLVVLEHANGSRSVVSQIEDADGPRTVEIHTTRCRIRIDEKQRVVEIVRGRNMDEVETWGDDIWSDFSVEGMIDRLLRDLLFSQDPPAASGGAGLAAMEILIAAHHSHAGGHKSVGLEQAAAELQEIWLPVT